ncbi:carbon monoxide dehydrogenase [Salinigranum rubrum]|uniref:Carbon monoxide dehydrogenase n=1 Tax=Salinigranum rubrum TaxID=755307 RepID=A0A2I8VKH3_9EURY|nr:SRPBCC domain-containing protein [Salinigranum rubrum]AUV82427.1 carbon monoxide dehydrogenase [Salinigranum rubrum]
MEFSGEFELDGVSPEDAWIVLSDPIAVRDALKGCRYITRIDGEDFNFDEYEPEEDIETLPDADPEVVAERAFVEGGVYAALMQVGVGSVKPRFETRVTIKEREFPHMVATGGGDASNSSFEMESWMDIEETETGSTVKWGTQADVSGRIAQLGGRVMNPVADKIVSNFFKNIQKQMTGFEESEKSSGIRDRLSGLL